MDTTSSFWNKFDPSFIVVLAPFLFRNMGYHWQFKSRVRRPATSANDVQHSKWWSFSTTLHYTLFLVTHMHIFSRLKRIKSLWWDLITTKLLHDAEVSFFILNIVWKINDNTGLTFSSFALNCLQCTVQ